MKLRAFSWIANAPLLVMLAVAPSFAADITAEGSFERTLKVSGPVNLDVTTGSGLINVRAGEPGTMRVLGTIRAGTGWHIDRAEAEAKVRRLEANPPIEQNGNVVRIGRIEDEDLRRNVSISYELVVPAETRLRSETGSGSQTIDGIRGPLEASAGSGSLRVRTGSGRITAQGEPTGEWRLHTGSGSVTVRLPQQAAFDLYARTSSGRIHTNHTITVEGTLNRREVRGKVRGGGHLVDVSTSSGSVEID